MPVPNPHAVYATLPDPPYPADTKANGWSPKIDWQLIKASTTWRICPPDMRNHLLRVWMESWNEVPAGSWENCEQLIAGASDIPQSLFDKHRDVFMRGWVLHADGRLYHQTVTKFVEDMILNRTGGNDRQRRHRAKLKAKRKAEEKAIEEGETNPLIKGEPCVTNPLIKGVSRVTDQQITDVSRVTVTQNTDVSRVTVTQNTLNADVSHAEGKGEEGKGEDRKEKNKEKNNNVENPPAKPAKPQTKIAVVSRDAPDLSVSDPVKPTAPEREIFDYWRVVMDHPKARLADKRRRCIKSRLKEGYSVADIKAAIDGCKGSTFHQGKNDNKTVYDDIELICRDATKLDAFIANAEKARREKAKLDDFLNGGGSSMLWGDSATDDRTIEGEFHAV